MKRHRQEYRVTKMCTVLAVSTSGYYVWLRRCESVRTAINRILLTRIKVIHGQSRQTYGSPRIAATLRAEGLVCNEKRVARLMRDHGIKAKTDVVVLLTMIQK